MEIYILIGLVIINLVIGVILYTKKSDTQEIKDEVKMSDIVTQFEKVKQNINESIYKNSKETMKDLGEFKAAITADNSKNAISFNNEISKFKESLYKNIDEQMDKINKKVELRLDEGFKKTNQTFTNILERLTKIDEAQKQIEKLSTNIVSLQDILGDKKSRGTFGEVQLNNILYSIFGENNTKIFEKQKKLSNGSLVDAILHAPTPLGSISIDSKFPLENYKRIVDINLTESEKSDAKKKFEGDLRVHIDAIASKYIIEGETSDQAILFLPAEAIFAEINAYHPKIVEYSQKKRVWLTSPTTLMSTLTTIQVILNNIERDKHAGIIQEELNKLGIEFGRFKDRWNKLERNISTVSKTVDELNTTSNKITSRFESISKVEQIINEDPINNNIIE